MAERISTCKNSCTYKHKGQDEDEVHQCKEANRGKNNHTRRVNTDDGRQKRKRGAEQAIYDELRVGEPDVY